MNTFSYQDALAGYKPDVFGDPIEATAFCNELRDCLAKRMRTSPQADALKTARDWAQSVLDDIDDALADRANWHEDEDLAAVQS